MAPTIIQEPTAYWSGTRLTNLNRRTFTLLQEMDRLTGAQRALICDPRGTPLAIWHLEAFPLSREEAGRVGACLANLFAAFQGHTFREIEIAFEDRLVYARTLGNAFLAVVCARDTALSLVRMTCNVAAAPFETDKELQSNLSPGQKTDIGMRLG
ncbi:MAG: hypothetical protein FJ009_03790 [Chloroflexi bacterium]|nr:hypothetical protein [Chloroflexota bacterium]